MNFRFLNGDLHLVNYVLARIKEHYNLKFDVIDIRVRALNSENEQVEFVDENGATPIMTIAKDSNLSTVLHIDKYELIPAGLTFFINPEDNPAHPDYESTKLKKKKE